MDINDIDELAELRRIMSIIPETEQESPTPPSYDTKYRLFLSEKDEYVPDSHVGMYSLFRNPKNTAVYMSEELCQSIRWKTYMETMELFKKYESPTYCQFFNYNADILTALGKNYFSTSEKFEPIAELVESFPHKVKTDNNLGVVSISYGIDKLVLKTYLQCLHDGKDFWQDPPISVKKRKKLQKEKRDFIMEEPDEVKMDYWAQLKMPRNPLYHRFLDWCKLQSIEAQEGMLMAIECLLYAYPMDDLKNVTEYDRIDEMDTPLYAKPRTKAKRIERTVTFSGQLCATADKIIERYNREPRNIAKRIDFDLYCNNALHLLNENMKLEYRDPDLYAETVSVDEAEAYNQKLLKDSGFEYKLPKYNTKPGTAGRPKKKMM